MSSAYDFVFPATCSILDRCSLCAGGVDVSMLQNAMQLLEGVDVETEASGNVMLQTVGKIASTGVHFISCGYLTHSVTALDISLRIHEDLLVMGSMS